VTEHWTTSELPGIHWDPADEPPDGEDEGQPRITTIHVAGDLL
jgi:hypothetical protein